MSKKQKYLLINKTETILAMIKAEQKANKTGKNKPEKINQIADTDMKISDGYVWVSLDGFCKNLGVHTDFFTMDIMLESMSKQAKQTGIFPIREFKIDE